MKIIFLDIDGVLNSWGFDDPEEEYTYEQKKPRLYYIINKKHINILNKIIKKTDAKVIISSAWRGRYNWDIIFDILKQKGFEGEVIGQTPEISLGSRGYEIHKWLTDQEQKPDNFVILDDIEWGGFHMFKKHFVQTESHEGLLEQHYEKAIKILNK